ncbi:hypothetical protein J2X50_000576 [Aminobacter sp. BE322]
MVMRAGFQGNFTDVTYGNETTFRDRAVVGVG